MPDLLTQGQAHFLKCTLGIPVPVFTSATNHQAVKAIAAVIAARRKPTDYNRRNALDELKNIYDDTFPDNNLYHVGTYEKLDSLPHLPYANEPPPETCDEDMTDAETEEGPLGASFHETPPTNDMDSTDNTDSTDSQQQDSNDPDENPEDSLYDKPGPDDANEEDDDLECQDCEDTGTCLSCLGTGTDSLTGNSCPACHGQGTCQNPDCPNVLKTPPETDDKTTEDQDSNPDKPPEQTIKKKRRPKGYIPLHETIIRYINAHCRNLYLFGPAGSGKTTQLVRAFQQLNYAVVIIPCSYGTPAYTFTGRRHPLTGAFEHTPFTSYFDGSILETLNEENGTDLSGIGIIFDELDKLDATAAASANCPLANDFIASPDGEILRGENVVIAATANTIGTGADRVYNDANQLGGATLDRFTGAFLEVDYDTIYEANTFDHRAVQYVHHVREVARNGGMRHIVSTRAIIGAERLLLGGFPESEWKAQVTVSWTDTDLATLYAATP